MKHTFNILCAIALLLSCILLTGCLDRQPISEIGEGSYYKNQGQMEAAVVACYNGLQAPMEYEWRFTETRSDNARYYTYTTNTTENATILHYDLSTIETTDDNIYKYWLASYNNIARCNTVLMHLDVVKDSTLHSQYEGEVCFIRAYHYFNLVRLFGPVVKVTDRITAEEAKKMERSSVQKIYELITQDLHIASRQLPNSYEPSLAGRATKWAAIALLAKVRITQGLYDNTTLELLKDIEQGSGAELLQDYAKIFDISNEMNKEIIFAIRYTGGGLGLGSPFGNYFAPNNSGAAVINGSGKGFNYPTNDLISAYSSDDLRRDVCFKTSYTKEDGTIISGKGAAYVCKYTSPVVLKNDGDKDWPIIRYADMVLLRAEVENELYGVDAALPYINMTRTRAGLAALSAADIANREAMRMAIEKERRLELAFENHRWFDLIRTNRVVDVMNAHWRAGSADYDEFYSYTNVITLTQNQLLLPIPQKERDINPNLTQNVGY